MERKKANIWRSLGLGLTVFLVIIIYAYGTEVTQVNLGELREERRQESLVRVIRALARPDIIAYDQEEARVNAPILVPCPEGNLPEIEPAPEGGPRLVISPGCAAPGESVHVEGFGFLANAEGPLRFVPGSDPNNNVSLGRDFINTDGSGHFEADLVLPERESDEVQYIRAVVEKSVGLPHFTKTAYDTWDKIIETVFLALLATTIGTALAVPLSFIAARNLMKTMRSPLAAVSLTALGWLAGIALAYQLSNWLGTVSEQAVASLLISGLSVVLFPVLAALVFRWAVPAEVVELPSREVRIARMVALLGLVVLTIYWLYALAGLMGLLGTQLVGVLGIFAFMGSFLFHGGDILRTLIPFIAAFIGGAATGSLLGRLGQVAAERLSVGVVRIMNIAIAALTGATFLAVFGWIVGWLYEIGNASLTLWGPAAVGAALGAFAAVRTKPKDTLPIGMVIYYIARTVFNTLRSVEALVMAIVFVIAVGIGPFAGMLALGLHTIVSLGKLYSEQVESIATGPMEAIQATGANRLQTIVYAVIPQIIPPYISYTLYRWDINVRMSTIIGFVGGGGIGFLLQQNINLLNYRGASTQMVAIAVVVATLDYVSSVVRERYT
ncbi:MAG TPA: ABC transporter permease subunit [Anaerolineales bacterium]|nr:ABC transporter permease subunit [Anaerolineales bacterium]